MKKHLQVIFVLIIYCLIFCSDDVFATFYAPTPKNVYYSTEGGGLTSAPLDSTSLGGTPYWRSYANSVRLFRWVINYDFTGINEDYIAFNFKSYNTVPQGYLSIEGLTCEAVPNTVPSQISYIGLVSYGFVCPNPHSTDVWVSYEIGSQGQANYDLWWPKSFGAYNDPNTAQIITSINNQSSQQQQQYNQIMDNNNSGNQSDFITFATNYFIDDKTGTKSFLNVVPNFLNQLSNGSCTPLTITIPFISRNNQLTIPCMVNFLGEQGFGNLIRIYQFVISFIVAYWLTVNWFKLFKETIDPFNYRIEVMDL